MLQMSDALKGVPAAAEAAFEKSGIRPPRDQVACGHGDQGLRPVPYQRSGKHLLSDRPADARLLHVSVPGHSCARRAISRACAVSELMNARLKSVLNDIEGYADDVHPAIAVAGSLKARGWSGKRVAIDRNSWFLTVNLYERLAAGIRARCSTALGMVEPLRRIKSAAELAQIEMAGTANDAGMQAGLHATRLGASENDVAADIMAAAIRAGSEYLGMDPFVTSGPRGGVPHTTWRRRKIESGDLVALETCACYNRYHAALFRTVGIGKSRPEAEDMYKACQEGLDAAIEKLRPGNTCADVHNACQAVIDSDGYTAAYRKRTGYSIGISFSPDSGRRQHPQPVP